MSSPLEQLRILRDQLRRQLDSNEIFVAWLAAERAVKEVERSVCGSAAFGNRLRDVLSVPERISDVALAILRESNSPLSTTQLYSKLIDAGVKFEGASPIKNLRSALSKDERLVSVHWKSDRAWWIKSLPRPKDQTTDPL